MINIVVPVYNSAKNLETCLFSLVNQTIKDLEIIHTKKINTNVDFLYLFATAILIFLSRAADAWVITTYFMANSFGFFL